MTVFGLPIKFRNVRKSDGMNGISGPGDTCCRVLDQGWIKYQSTGHKDPAGKEIFFADLVLHDGEVMVVEWGTIEWAIISRGKDRSIPWDWFLPEMLLGNIHMTKTDLRHRYPELDFEHIKELKE